MKWKQLTKYSQENILLSSQLTMCLISHLLTQVIVLQMYRMFFLFTLMSVNALCQSVKNRVQGWWLIVPLKTMTTPEGKGRVRLLPLCCIYYFLQRKTKTTTLTSFWSDFLSCIKELGNDDSEASSIKVCLLVQELLGFLFIVVQFSLSVCTAGMTIVRKDI